MNSGSVAKIICSENVSSTVKLTCSGAMKTDEEKSLPEKDSSDKAAYANEQGSPQLDSWNLWSQVYSDRDMRLKLYCRDPEEKTPCVSNTLVVRNIHLDCSPKFIVDLFSKFGPIIRTSFPAVLRHYQSRYSFIKYKEIRDAIQACQFYNGYKLKGRILEVVHYDSAYKYCKMAERSKNDQLKCSTEENINGYVRQAYLQSESRTAKVRPFNPSKSTSSSSFYCPLMNNKAQANISFENSQDNVPELSHSTPGSPSSSSKQTVRFAESVQVLEDTSNDEDKLQPSYCNDILADPDEDENRVKKHIKCVDDVGLESEECFLEWLRAKLNFTGPQHYTHPDIARAWHKLPPSVRRRFDWLLGFLRSADSFIMVGPFISLPEHAYWAKEMCVVAMLDYKTPFKEMWEPLHPSEIVNDRQIIKYIKALLTQFGPLSVTDNKIQLLLRTLPDRMRGDPAYSPDGLCRILEHNQQFLVHKEVYYLAREHDHLLSSLLSTEKLTSYQSFAVSSHEDPTISLTTSTVTSESIKDSGCGSSTKSASAAPTPGASTNTGQTTVASC